MIEASKALSSKIDVHTTSTTFYHMHDLLFGYWGCGQVFYTNKNEASGDSAQPIFMIKVSIDRFISDLSTVICFMSILLARAEIFLIYQRPLEDLNRY